MAKGEGYWVEEPKQKYLERLGRLYSMYRIARSQAPKTKVELANPRIGASKSRLARQKVGILFLASEPSDEVRLRLASQARDIEEQLRGSKYRERFSFNQKGAVRTEDLSQAMLDLEPQIVHFSGHGAKTGELCFEGGTGAGHLVRPQPLAALFREFSDTVECVILDACYSVAQAEAISSHVDYVIGMEGLIGYDTAIAFSIGLYQAIGAGKLVDEAYRLGCVQINLKAGGTHVAMPVLDGKISRKI